MRVICVTRSDSGQVAGGDVVLAQSIQREIRRLGVEFDIMPVQDLAHEDKADALHLTQLHQLGVAEQALRWAESRRIAVFISPLFEEVLALVFRQAVRHNRKWRIVCRVLGLRLAESVYVAWQTINRPRSLEWRRQKALLQRCHIVANTHYELSHLVRWFDLRDVGASIVPLAIDPAIFSPARSGEKSLLPDVLEPHRGRYVLEVGLVSARKNQDGLLRALAATDHPIAFLGKASPYEPEYYGEVRQLARERGNVIFLDWVSEGALPALYRESAVHILPSWSERPGLVTIEAAACGCKVISTNRAPVWEYLGSGGWYCDPARPASILQALGQALEQPVPSDLSDAVRGQYTWARTARALKQTYETVLEEPLTGR
jgi:glycosyltransferase involved in cell wall biosynthesis